MNLYFSLIAITAIMKPAVVESKDDPTGQSHPFQARLLRGVVPEKRQLDLGPIWTAVDFPNPCFDLPAGRTPHDGAGPGDDGWELVDFCPSYPGGDCNHNDDLWTSEALSFLFSLDGSDHTIAYVNNNGNLSFDQGYSKYTPEGFPVVGHAMVAPFWADIDTRVAVAHVWIKRPSPNVLAVAWDEVGFYFANGSLRNTFQVLISDGADPNMGIGNNVCFCYANMEWTTGDASGGINGFGGTPATVGMNVGNGEDFLQIGRFDKPGTAYDGPFGSNDGVNYLDGKTFCFNAAAVRNCCEAHGRLGCCNTACEKEVCGIDFSCCDMAWTQACANLAKANCGNLCRYGGDTCCPTCFENPCEDGARGRDLYHDHCDDPTQFIQCNAWGKCFEKPCAPGTVWNDAANTCVHA